jgi:predicted RecA/RadA family phage recombinase
MKNYIQDDDNITVAAPYAVSSGDGCLVGSLFGVAIDDADIAADVVLVTEGVFELTKVSTEVWTVGEIVYWNDGTAKSTTTTAGSNKRIGVAIQAAANPSATGIVRLDGVTS